MIGFDSYLVLYTKKKLVFPHFNIFLNLIQLVLVLLALVSIRGPRLPLLLSAVSIQGCHLKCMYSCRQNFGKFVGRDVPMYRYWYWHYQPIFQYRYWLILRQYCQYLTIIPTLCIFMYNTNFHVLNATLYLFVIGWAFAE